MDNIISYKQDINSYNKNKYKESIDFLIIAKNNTRSLISNMTQSIIEIYNVTL
jgi:hypothetical protein